MPFAVKRREMSSQSANDSSPQSWEPRMGYFERLLVSASALGLVFLGVAGAVLNVGALRAIPLVLFALVGFGAAPLQLVRSVSIAFFAAGSIAISISSLILVSFVMAEVSWWHPRPVLIGLGVGAVVIHGMVVWSLLWDAD